MNQPIPIFFTIDDAYAPFLGVALNSAICHADPNKSYRAIVLHQGLNETNVAKLKALQTDYFHVEIIEMKNRFDAITDSIGTRLRCDYFTLTIYFRLFIPTMFPQYDKGIYIDSDVVLNGDIAELFDIDIGDNFIGACNDLSIADTPPLVAYTENAIGVKANEYINSGVLLMNLKKMRESGFEEHFLNLLNTYHFDCIAPDQDYLNAICNGNIYYLSEVWDAMPNDQREPLSNPKLIHYNLFSKPWCYDNIQYGDLFWHHAETSGYYDEIVAYKNGYSDEQKQSDTNCLRLLVERGLAIAATDTTFKAMFENGVKIRL